jgi:hypothetical protein
MASYIERPKFCSAARPFVAVRIAPGPTSPDDTPYTVVSRSLGSTNGGCCPRLELSTEVGLRNSVHATKE